MSEEVLRFGSAPCSELFLIFGLLCPIAVTVITSQRENKVFLFKLWDRRMSARMVKLKNEKVADFLNRP